MPKNKHLFQIVFAVIIFTAFSVGFSPLAHAQQPFTYTPLATVQNLTTAGTPISPADYVQNLYFFAFSIGIVIAVVSGVWAGVEYMLSEAITSKENAKKRIYGVIWGFALLLSSYVILDLINPQLVNWNFNLGASYNSNSNLSNDLTAQISAQQTIASQSAIALQTAQLANQTAQQQVTALQDQIGVCADMQTDPNNNSAANLAVHGCDSAGVAALATKLAAAQTTANGTQVTASTAAANNTTASANTIVTEALNYKKDGVDQATAIAKITQATQIADGKLSQQASSLSNIDMSSDQNILAQKQVVDQNANMAIAIITAKSSTASTDTLSNALAAYSQIQQAQDAVTTLQKEGQVAAAASLSQEIATNTSLLDSVVSDNFQGCTSAQALYSANHAAGIVSAYQCGH